MAVDESPGPGRVLIAANDPPLEPEPVWVRFDNIENLHCGGFDWRRGRQTEFDVTTTGSARVYFSDRASQFLDESVVGLQVMLQLYDPVLETWEPVFRGHIEDLDTIPSSRADGVVDVQMECVGLFAYLASVKMVVGTMGETLTGKEKGVVKFAEAPVDERLDDLVEAAGLASGPTGLCIHFTGNVDVHKTYYDTDDNILSAMRDAADAEFPGIGNIYEDRYGREVFHGRFAKFDPDTTSSGAEWNFTRWAAGTRDDVIAGQAQIREFQYNRPRGRIINSYCAWPELDLDGFPFHQSVIANNTKIDAVSITAYGYHGEEAPALIIKQHKTNGNSGLQECELFAQYYVSNYAAPRKNVERITFKGLPPDEPRAADVWALMTRADISDIIALYVDEAGLFGDEYFIEGISGSCRVGPPEYDIVTVTPNLSPAAYYADDVFGS